MKQGPQKALFFDNFSLVSYSNQWLWKLKDKKIFKKINGQIKPISYCLNIKKNKKRTQFIDKASISISNADKPMLTYNMFLRTLTRNIGLQVGHTKTNLSLFKNKYKEDFGNLETKKKFSIVYSSISKFNFNLKTNEVCWIQNKNCRFLTNEQLNVNGLINTQSINTKPILMIQKAFELSIDKPIYAKQEISELYISNKDLIMAESKDFLISRLRGKTLQFRLNLNINTNYSRPQLQELELFIATQQSLNNLLLNNKLFKLLNNLNNQHNWTFNNHLLYRNAKNKNRTIDVYKGFGPLPSRKLYAKINHKVFKKMFYFFSKIKKIIFLTKLKKNGFYSFKNSILFSFLLKKNKCFGLNNDLFFLFHKFNTFFDRFFISFFNIINLISNNVSKAKNGNFSKKKKTKSFKKNEISFFSKKIFVWRSISSFLNSEVQRPYSKSNLGLELRKKANLKKNPLKHVTIIQLRKNKSYNSLVIRKQFFSLLLNKQIKNNALLSPTPSFDFKIKYNDFYYKIINMLLAKKVKPNFNFGAKGKRNFCFSSKTKINRSKKLLKKSQNQIGLKENLQKADNYSLKKKSFSYASSDFKQSLIINSFNNLIFKKSINILPLVIGYNKPYGVDFDFLISNLHFNSKILGYQALSTIVKANAFPSILLNSSLLSKKKKNQVSSKYAVHAYFLKKNKNLDVNLTYADNHFLWKNQKNLWFYYLAQLRFFKVPSLFAQPCFSFFISKKLTHFIQRFKQSYNSFKESNSFKEFEQKSTYTTIKINKFKSLFLYSNFLLKNKKKVKLFFTFYTSGGSLYQKKVIFNSSKHKFIKCSFLSSCEGEFLKTIAFPVSHKVESQFLNFQKNTILKESKRNLNLKNTNFSFFKHNLKNTEFKKRKFKNNMGFLSLILTKNNLISYFFNFKNDVKHSNLNCNSLYSYKFVRENFFTELMTYRYYKYNNIFIKINSTIFNSFSIMANNYINKQSLNSKKITSFSNFNDLKNNFDTKNVSSLKPFINNQYIVVQNLIENILVSTTMSKSRKTPFIFNFSKFKIKASIKSFAFYKHLKDSFYSSKKIDLDKAFKKDNFLNKNLSVNSSLTSINKNKVFKINGLIAGFSKQPGISIFKNKLSLGEFFVFGDKIMSDPHSAISSKEQYRNLVKRKKISRGLVSNNKRKIGLTTGGQIIHINQNKITLRRAQPLFISPKSILHFTDGSFVRNNDPVMTLTYQRLKTGDIVQGIPKVEQYFEARITKQGRLFRDCLPNLLKGLFKRYRSQLPLEKAVRQSFYKIQQIIVDGVLRVYRSQGVTIADKHLEVIVRQMTSKVKIINGAQTGFFPGEIIDLQFVERVNLSLMKKIQYEPLILGITRAALEVDSFLSAASFQQTTRVLSSAAIEKRKDFLKGLKENILLGNLMPAGTGYLVSFYDF
jgi:hypothetical protein